MKILSHRGFWHSVAEKNTPDAFIRSFDEGFGTETDLRDLNGQLVIAHDPATDDAMTAADCLALHQNRDPSLPLALNIKADGLQKMVGALLEEFAPCDAFVFDMSIPDMLHWLNAGVPVFTRHSDIEPDHIQRHAGFFNHRTDSAQFSEMFQTLPHIRHAAGNFIAVALQICKGSF